MSGLPSLADFKGLDPDTGGAVAGDDHLRQSIKDILTTPIGTRVMRRTYGSRLFALIDSPMTGRVAAIVAAAAEAISAWEPRVKLQKVEVVDGGPGFLDLNLVVILNGLSVRLEGVLS